MGTFVLVIIAMHPSQANGILQAPTRRKDVVITIGQTGTKHFAFIAIAFVSRENAEERRGVDVAVIEEMIDKYHAGNDIVYGVRKERKTDTFFKRTTAQGFYKLLAMMGAEVVYNHADYRLISSRVLQEFADFKEVNLFLRGMVPMLGFKSDKVYYERRERFAGESKYSLGKMLDLACIRQELFFNRVQCLFLLR